MLCPKCRNNVTGKWCVFCGANLAEENPASPEQTQRHNQNSMAWETAKYKPEDFYRDDTPANNQTMPAEEYYNPQKDSDPYGGYYDQPPAESKGKLIAIISICATVVVIMGIVLFKFVFTNNDSNKKTNTSNDNTETVQTDPENRIKDLTKQGQQYMSQGDYEEAEDIYSELSELTNDKETKTIYKILYNYNSSVKKLNSGDYTSAERFYNQIPSEYINYDISDDVTSLKKEIQNAKKTKSLMKDLREYIAQENLVDARNTIGLINETYLTSAEKLELNDLTNQLIELESQEKAEEEAKKKAEEEELKRKEEEEKLRQEELANKPSGYGYLSNSDAHGFIYDYATQLTRAINENNFNLVSPYIYSSSPLYTQQINLVNSCVSQGITESFDGVTLNSLTKISDTKWDAKVTEKETVYYADGSQKAKTFNWTYTIEYVDDQFYLTGIK